MTLVVDASVALKWVLDEPDRAVALALIGAEPLLAPDFLWLECANVLAMKAKARKITADAATRSLHSLRAVPIRLTPTLDHLDAAQAIALAIGRTVYDSLYLAVALAEGAVLITADARFATAASAAYPQALRML